MPTRSVWVEPELFLVHNDVAVYSTYHDDDIDQGASLYVFTTNPDSDDEHFDVRELNVPAKDLLTAHPLFLAADCNPAYASASAEQKVALRKQWEEWLKVGGGEAQAIVSVLKQAIEMGLVTSPED